jgi:hypothetical protein
MNSRTETANAMRETRKHRARGELKRHTPNSAYASSQTSARYVS